ncbi:MAG: hypothetical protein JSV65_16785 [Armatimonadota bacterium]|nr:MAG: hypothetical protein JSV65_16785 [Armatimonadota bacterium]
MPEGKRGTPPGFKAAIIVLLVAWLVVLVVLSRFQSTQQRREAMPVLPMHPDALDADVRALPDRGWKSATYFVPLDYPALDVFAYYDDRMKEQRWSRLDAPAAPEWEVSSTDSGKRATLLATWVGPEELTRLDLHLTWEERTPPPGDTRPSPRMKVVATMSRDIIPSFPTRRAEEKPEKEDAPFAQ